MHLLIYIDIALFIFIAFFIGYDLFFTLASFFRRSHRKHRSIRLQKFAVIFAAYKEDQVIQESVERILLQDYPADKYRVIVVSDHMREETNQALAKLPIELLTPDFEHSMKHKSITYALEYLKEGIDKVVILDADNLTDTDFLTRINDITQDNIALQAHRTLKNDNTPIAVWDGISEEINNTIVYAVNSGAKYYHAVQVCGNQSNRRSLTVREAILEGLGACSDCNPPSPSDAEALIDAEDAAASGETPAE